MSTKALSIVHRAADLLQDLPALRWPTNEIVRWLNDAQRAIIKIRPDSTSTTAPMRLAAGFRQDLLSSTANGGTEALSPVPVKLIDITYNTAAASKKNTVTKVSRDIMDAAVPGWRALPGSVNIQHFMFDVREPHVFEVYPPALATAELQVIYSAAPVDITEPADGALYSSVTGNISLPDNFADDILNFVLYRCYSKKSEFAGDTARAQTYQALLIASLGDEIKSTLAVQPK